MQHTAWCAVSKNMSSFIESNYEAIKMLHNATYRSIMKAVRSIARESLRLIKLILKDC